MPGQSNIQLLWLIKAEGVRKTQGDLQKLGRSSKELLKTQREQQAQLNSTSRELTKQRTKLSKATAQSDKMSGSVDKNNKIWRLTNGTINKSNREISKLKTLQGRYGKELAGTNRELTMNRRNALAIPHKKFRQDIAGVNREEKNFGKSLSTVNKKLSAYRAQVAAGVNLTSKQRKEVGRLTGEQKKLGKTQSRSILGAAKWAVAWTAVYSTIRLGMNTVKDLVGTFITLNTTMARVSTVTRTNGKDINDVMESMEAAVLSYASKTGANINKTAEVLYHLGSAGLTVKQQMAGMDRVMNLTIGTFGNVTQVARLVAGMYNVFGDSIEGAVTESEKFKKITDILAFTYSTQQVELSELAGAMGLVGSAAGLMDITTKELVGTLGFLNTGLLRGTRAGTSLLNALVKIAQNADSLKSELGLAFDVTKPLKFRDVMEQLNSKFEEGKISVEEQKKLFRLFGLRGTRAITSIIKRWDDFKAAVDVSEQSFEGFADFMSEQVQDTLPRQLSRFSNIIKEKLNLSGTIDSATDSLKNFNDRLTRTEELQSNIAISVLSQAYTEAAKTTANFWTTAANKLLDTVKKFGAAPISPALDLIASELGFLDDLNAAQNASLKLQRERVQLSLDMQKSEKFTTGYYKQQRDAIGAAAAEQSNLSTGMVNLLDVHKRNLQLINMQNDGISKEKIKQQEIQNIIDKIVSARKGINALNLDYYLTQLKTTGTLDENAQKHLDILSTAKEMKPLYKALGELLQIQLTTVTDIGNSYRSHITGAIVESIDELKTFEELSVDIFRRIGSEIRNAFIEEGVDVILRDIPKKLGSQKLAKTVGSEREMWSSGNKFGDGVTNILNKTAPITGGLIAHGINKDGDMIGLTIGASIGSKVGDFLGPLLTNITGTGNKWWAGPFGALVSISTSILGGVWGSRQKLSDIQKDTNKTSMTLANAVSGTLDPTYKELQIVNRNLVDIKQNLVPYALPESAYFSMLPKFHGGGQIPGSPGQEVPIMGKAGEVVSDGPTVGSITIHVGSDAQKSDVIDAINEIFGNHKNRGYIRK